MVLLGHRLDVRDVLAISPRLRPVIRLDPETLPARTFVSRSLCSLGGNSGLFSSEALFFLELELSLCTSAFHLRCGDDRSIEGLENAVQLGFEGQRIPIAELPVRAQTRLEVDSKSARGDLVMLELFPLKITS